MTSLIDALVALSRRERRLIGLLLGIGLPVLLFAALEPLVAQRSTAARSLATAEDLSRWIGTQARRYPAPAGPVDTPSAPRPAPGMAGLEQSLVAAGLRDQVTNLSNRRENAVELRFDSVGFAAVMRWLSDVETTAGYQPASFTLEALETPGLIAATLVLEPAS